MTHANDYAAIWRQVRGLPWCALVTTGRTGTDFFQSLLDSHPEIFGFNGKLFFHDFWASSAAANFDGPLNASDIADEFIGAHIRHFKSRYDTIERKGELGNNRDQSIDIDSHTFRVHLLGLLEGKSVAPREFLIAVYVAYALCLGQDIGRKKLFLHHQHRIGRLGPFMREFPTSKIICMTRDPRANYVSGVEHWRRFEPMTDNPSYPLYILSRAIEEPLQLRAYNPDTVRVVRLEDLGDERTLRAICDWLGVSYHPCMKESTWAGLRWWGDRLSPNTIRPDERGFSPTIIANRWQEKLGHVDRFLLDYLLGDMLLAYGYVDARPGGMVAGLIAPFLIPLPTSYERRYLNPGYLLAAIRGRRLRVFLATFYHPLRRIAYFYRLLLRRWTHRIRFLPMIDARTRS